VPSVVLDVGKVDAVDSGRLPPLQQAGEQPSDIDQDAFHRSAVRAYGKAFDTLTIG